MKNQAILHALILAGLAGPVAFGQRADVSIEPERTAIATPEILERLGELRTAGRLLSSEAVVAALKNPTPQPVRLPSPAVEQLRPAQIAALARKSVIRVGWYYLCKRCDNWHVNLAGGYIVAEKGVAVSCHHVLVPKADMREGYLIAQDLQGNAYPVRQILASDEELDSVVFQLEGADALPPLPLNDQVFPGDPAFLLSDPKSYSGYFTEGIVNRFYWRGGTKGDLTKWNDLQKLRINVSTDWAPGSSGSPVLDEFGNVIGHVSRIRTEVATPQSNERAEADRAESQPPPTTSPATTQPIGARNPTTRPFNPGTQIVLREGIPARSVRFQIDLLAVPATQPVQDP